ncbi:glycosyltransferase [Lentibacillus sp. Marseille-P4043]|uniref:glycosyltransferase n=1 Tax=Lentibacillus sp. Marseille-P4043 TaxID=2040293 RepID=UPI001F29BCF8|nr:glycosyltransferase [Lentibacillus sp. Marseille-P4043]
MVINMNVGGTEKALLNMIAEMPETKFDITVLMLEEYGGFLHEVPSRVNVVFAQEYPKIKDLLNKPTKTMIIKLFKEGKAVKAMKIFLVYFLSKMANNRSIFFKYILKKEPPINDHYDIAVAYAGPMDFISYFVINKIKARKKIQWIHFDITKIGFNKAYAKRLYQKFDNIYVVSKEGKAKCVQVLPELSGKIDVFSNRYSPDLVVRRAEEGPGFVDNFKGIRILTVGRLSKEKGQDLAIPVLAMLKEQGYDVRWYCIGDGNAREEYEQLIKEYGLENDFLLLGAKTNPYPFMKQCNIYVQPSRHEGYCITLSEVKCFHKPIVSTEFTGVYEHITHGETGLVVNFNKEDMYDAIKRFMQDLHIDLIAETVGDRK